MFNLNLWSKAITSILCTLSQGEAVLLAFLRNYFYFPSAINDIALKTCIRKKIRERRNEVLYSRRLKAENQGYVKHMHDPRN